MRSQCECKEMYNKRLPCRGAIVSVGLIDRSRGLLCNRNITMLLYKTLIFALISSTFVAVRTYDDELFRNVYYGVSPPSTPNPMQIVKLDDYNIYDYAFEYKIQDLATEKVNISLYYEVFCPGCRQFDTEYLKPTVEKLASYLNVKVFPYGNAKTTDKGNDQYEFKCQHGPEECYGNKLHACAIDYLGNITKAIFFNACMMDFSRSAHGSDDNAADECGKSMNVDSEVIKKCAKGDKGNQLLKYYGEESKKVGFEYVPYVMINGVEIEDADNFFDKVCATFKTPPPECAQNA